MYPCSNTSTSMKYVIRVSVGRTIFSKLVLMGSFLWYSSIGVLSREREWYPTITQPQNASLSAGLCRYRVCDGSTSFGSSCSLHA